LKKKIKKIEFFFCGAPDAPEDQTICLFAGLLANPDMSLSHVKRYKGYGMFDFFQLDPQSPDVDSPSICNSSCNSGLHTDVEIKVFEEGENKQMSDTFDFTEYMGTNGLHTPTVDIITTTPTHNKFTV
jgi:hypothetical protein